MRMRVGRYPYGFITLFVVLVLCSCLPASPVEGSGPSFRRDQVRDGSRDRRLEGEHKQLRFGDDGVSIRLPAMRQQVYYYYKFPNTTAYWEGNAEPGVELFYENAASAFENVDLGCGLTFHEGIVEDAFIEGFVTKECTDDIPLLLAAHRDGVIAKKEVIIKKEEESEGCVWRFDGSKQVDWNSRPAWMSWEPPSTQDLVVFSGVEHLTSIASGEFAVAGGVVFEWDDSQSKPQLHIEPDSDFFIFGISKEKYLDWKECDGLNQPSPTPSAAPYTVPFEENVEDEPAFLNEWVQGNLSLSFAGGDIGAPPAGSELTLMITSVPGKTWRLRSTRDWIDLEYDIGSGDDNVTVSLLDTERTTEPQLYEGSIVIVMDDFSRIVDSIEVRMEIVRPILQISPGTLTQVLFTGTNGTTGLVLSNDAPEHDSDDELLEDLSTLRFTVHLEQLTPENDSWAFFGSIEADDGQTPCEVLPDGGRNCNLKPQRGLRLDMEALAASLPRGDYEARVVIVAETYSEDFVVNWIVRVARFNVCPDSFSARLGPGEVDSRTFSISNLSPSEPLPMAIDLSGTAPWISVLSFPHTLQSGGVPHFATISIKNIPDFSGASELQTTFDLISGVSSNKSSIGVIDGESLEEFADISRRTVNVTLIRTSGTIDAQRSSLRLNVTQRESSVTATAEIFLRDSIQQLVPLGGAIPGDLEVSSTIWGRESSADLEVDLRIDDDTEGTVIVTIRPDRVGMVEVSVKYAGQHIDGSPMFRAVEEAICSDPTQIQTRSRMECHCKAGYEPPEDDQSTEESCVKCEQGYMKSAAGNDQCVPCGEDEFSWEGATSCTACPPAGAVCDDGTLRLRDGYWREEDIGIKDIDESTILHECDNQDICLVARNESGRPAQCAEGHKGVLCDTCEPNYAKSGSVCLKCGDRSTNIAITVLLILAFALVVMFIALKKKDQKDPKTSPATLARLTVNWLQACAMLSEFTIQVFDEVQTMLSIGESANGGSAISLHTVQCVLQFDYFTKFYIIFSIPVIAVILPSLIVGILLLRDKILGTDPFKAVAAEDTDEKTAEPESPFQKYSNAAMSAIVALQFLSYNTVLKFIVSSWDFYPYEINGSRHLRSDFSVTEDDPQYKVVFALSLIGTVFYIIGIPLLGFRVLTNNRRKLSNIVVRRRFGFLYEGYRRDRFLFVVWEIIVLLRKTSLTMISILINNGLLQLSSGIFVLFVAMVLQESVRPYVSKTANRLELASLCVLLSTAVAALINYSTTVRDDEGAQFGVAVTVIIMNACIAVAFAVTLVILSSKKVMEFWAVLVEKCNKKTKEWREAISGQIVSEEISDSVDRLIKGERVETKTLVNVFSGSLGALRQLLADKEAIPAQARSILEETAEILEQQQSTHSQKARRVSLETAQKQGWLQNTEEETAGSMFANPLTQRTKKTAKSPEEKSELAQARWRKIRVYVKMFGAMGVLSRGEQKALEREQQEQKVLAASGKRVPAGDRRSTFRPEPKRKSSAVSSRSLLGRPSRAFQPQASNRRQF
eukprot:gb/GECG01013613.1/.p1 GENE.gb/GECG01013613.1/~~gb/GECG01013613.1/.p1  ORF type:complete len:1527 (+),score=175.53 gb/GECG01013613.1/:1-4581(+)